jgi:serine/threonine protein kinase
MPSAAVRGLQDPRMPSALRHHGSVRVPDVGQTFQQRYALRERLGDGGTASVFRADDLELGRTVAIKVYGPESEVSDADRRQREARALAGLRHPAIVTLFDARLDATPPYLVLEFVDGETLARRIGRGALPAVEARLIGAAAASGLAAAHDAGIVHRDVKPANIVIPNDSSPAEARLLDFGIAHALGGSRATSVGSVLGSAVYVSPEQARGEEVTPASDVYSLGLVLIECLTGRPPFSGSTPEVLAARLVQPPKLDDPALAADAALLSRMTALEAADRPTAEEVAASLEMPAATRVLTAGGTVDTDLPTEPMTQAAAPVAARAPRRAPIGAVLAVAGGLLATVLVIATLSSGLSALSPGPAPSDSPSPDVVEVTPTPDESDDEGNDGEDDDDDAPGNSGNAPGQGNDKKP